MPERPSYLHLRRALEGSERPPALSPGVVEVPFHLQHTPALHALLVRSYAGGEGLVAPYDVWLPALLGDGEFDARSCFVLLRGDVVVAAALCWSSAFIKDLCVAEEQRRRGLGSYLLLRAFAHFAARGAPAVELKVEVANTNARRLYARHGFAQVAER